MKKIAPIAMVALIGALSLTSCKKNYTCDCTYSVSGVSQTYSWQTGKVKKSDAKAACEGYTATGWTNISCSLK